MTNIDVSLSVQNALKQAAVQTSKSPLERKSSDAAHSDATRQQSADPRAERDTVTLSDGANKIVNLNRAQEMGNDLKNAAPEDLAKKLEQASKDVFRITALFNETVRAMLARWR